MRQTLRQIVAVLALGGIAMSLVPQALAATYTDLSAANKLATAGIIVDKSANPADYRLGDTLTRAEATKVAGKGMGVVLEPVKSAGCTSRFSDVLPGTWECAIIEIAAKSGLTKVEAGKAFRPTAPLNKYEAMAFAFRSSCTEVPAGTGVPEMAKIAAEAGIIANAASWNGTAAATRGEFFRYVATAMEDSSCDIPEDEEALCTLMPEICEDVDTPDEETTTDGDVEVSLSSDSPKAQTVPQTGLVPFGKFDISADEDSTVTSIKLKREGLSNRSDIERVYFELDGVRVSNRSNVSVDDEVLLSFSPALQIEGGETVTLDLIVELKSTAPLATVGAEHRFSLLSSSDVESTGSVKGTYPVRTATMKIGSYTVETVELTAVGDATGSVNVGDTNVLLGEFRLDNGAAEKDVMVKTVTLRNDGDADIESSLSNLALWSNGEEVSTNVQINTRDVTFTLDTVIEDGKSENFEIRADVSGAERDGEQYEFRVRNSTDVTVVEVESGFSAPITLPLAPWDLGTVTVEGGDLLLSRDSAYTTTQTVSPNTSDVVLWAAKLNVDEPVEFEDVRIAMNLAGGANMDQISSLRFVVGNSTIASVTPAANTGSFNLDLDAQFTISANTNLKVIANLRSNATGTFNTTGVTLGYTDARYLSNDEVAAVTGSAIGINTTVSNATLSITQNDGIDNFNIVAGAKDVTVLGFALRASDVSDVRVTSMNPSTTGSTVVLSNISNVRLYQGATLISTKNNFDFSSLNITIPKNTSKSFTIVADFNTSVSAGQDLVLTLGNAQISSRDVASNTNISETGSASNTFDVVGAGTVVATANSSTALATIVTPSSTEASAFKFDVEAENDKARVTDVYITSSGAVNLAQALRSSSLTLGGTTVSGVILDANTLHFPLSSNGVVLNKDQKLTADLKVAFFDSTVRTNQAFTFSLPAGSVTGQVTGTANGMRVISDSTGETITRTGGAISSNSHLLARSKPTVAATAFTPSTNDLYRFSVSADANRKVTLQDLALSIEGSAAASLAGATISVYRDNESAGNLVFTNRANSQTLANATPTAAAVGVAQVSTFTPANVEIGDTFTATINGTSVSFVATANTVANVTAGLTAAINANGTLSPVVTAAVVGGAVQVTADVVNTAFTVASSTTNGASTYVANVGNRDIEAGATVQFIVKISGGTPATDEIREARVTQVVYSDDVTTPANISVSNYNVGVPTSVSSYKY